MIIRVIIDPVDDGDAENYHVSVLADATNSIEGIKKILELAIAVVSTTIPSLAVGTIDGLLNPEVDIKKQN